MLKILRRGAIENPWFYRTIMGLIAAAFIISMGWWGFRSQRNPAVYAAKVDNEIIPIEEYERAYKSTYRAYKEVFKENIKDINEDMIKKLVIDNLIEQRLWLREAQRMLISVSREELTDLITGIPAFQRDGRFNQELYRRILTANHTIPEIFEKAQIENLLIEKAKRVVRESITLTEDDLKDVEAILKGGKEGVSGPAMEKRTREHLIQKQMRGVVAYTDILKRNANIEIKRDTL